MKRPGAAWAAVSGLLAAIRAAAAGGHESAGALRADEGPSYFQLQYVGIQQDGLEQPRSPMDGGSLDGGCLTAGVMDGLAGVSLEFKECQDPNAASTGDLVADALRESQKFSLELDGRIRSRMTGFCVRLVTCEGKDMFDLGTCESSETVVFQVEKAQADDIDHLALLGNPGQAVARELCSVCGAYRLTYRCRGKALPGRGAGCNKEYHAAPGWSKGGSQFLDPSRFVGKDEGGMLVKAETHTQDLIHGLGDMKGLMRSVNYCGTFVGMGPSGDSFFYFNKGAR